MVFSFCLQVVFNVILDMLLIYINMEDNSFPNNDKKPSVIVGTEQKVGLGLKVAITVTVVGAIAAGIFIAILISQ